MAHEAAVVFWNVAEETPRPLQKLHRGSACKWLSSTWTMLASLTGRGWDGCRLPEPEERRLRNQMAMRRRRDRPKGRRMVSLLFVGLVGLQPWAFMTRITVSGTVVRWASAMLGSTRGTVVDCTLVG